MSEKQQQEQHQQQLGDDEEVVKEINVDSEESEDVERENWSGKLDFFLSALSYSGQIFSNNILNLNLLLFF